MQKEQTLEYWSDMIDLNKRYTFCQSSIQETNILTLVVLLFHQYYALV